MLKKRHFMIVCLAVSGLFFSIKTYQAWRTDPLAASAARAPQAPPAGKGAGRQSEGFSMERRLGPKSAFQEIPALNLFAPDRAEYKPLENETAPPVTEVSEETPRIDGRQITLFGVVILPGRVAALISNPQSKPGEKQTLWVSPDDRVGDLTVEQITAQSVLLSGNGKRYRAPLFEKDKPRSSDAVRSASVKSASQKPTVVTTRSLEPPAPKEKATETAPAQNNGYQTITTPFGDIKRKTQ